jgi:hypothetical protein
LLAPGERPSDEGVGSVYPGAERIVMAVTLSPSGLTYVEGTDAENAFPAIDEANQTIVNAAMFWKSGTLAARPAVADVPPGSEYYATDTGQLFKSMGSAWVPLQMGFPARGYKGAGSAVGGPGWSEFLVDTVAFDPGSCFSSGACVCPTAGYYAVSGQTAITSTVTGYMGTGILKNPSGTNPVSASYVISVGSEPYASVTSEPVYTNVYDIVQCAQGDKLVLGCYSSASVNQTITLGSTVNYLAVQPVLG